MKIKNAHFLIVDDEPQQRNILAEFLKGLGARTSSASNGMEGLELIKKSPDIDLVITDLQMPEMDGLDLIKAAKQFRDDLLIIIVTAHGTIDSAIQAMKLGAADYIQKPLEFDEVEFRIAKLLKMRALTLKNDWLETENKRLNPSTKAVFESASMKSLFSDIRKILASDTTVLLTGETGVGKEVIANYIHQNSSRAKGPFIAINCSAIPDNLLESQFFGHEKGSFTGADKRMLGSFELADGGTLFLDEIGEMDLKLQAKILRALEERKIVRLGSPQPLDIDVRIITATNKNLQELVNAKQFREDLYYRLKVVHFNIPPLRDRMQDLPGLIQNFVEREMGDKKKSHMKIEPSFIETLSQYNFPGNVRELRNIIERAVLFANNNTLSASSLPSEVVQKDIPRPAAPLMNIPSDKSLSELTNDYEKQVITSAVQSCEGDREKAAKILKISRSALYAKLSKYGVS